MQRTENKVPYWADEELQMVDFYTKEIQVYFTKESWCGAVYANRGVGVALNAAEADQLLQELMNELVEEEFEIPFELVILK